MIRPRPTVVVLVLSGMTLIATPLAIAVAGSVGTGAVVQSVGDRQAAADAPSALVPPVSGAAPGVSISSIERSDAALPVPTAIDIPSLDVAAPIVAVGLDAHQAVEVPDDISTVGWYSLGVAPGSRFGSAVIVGHRDGRVAGHGAFYDLARLSPGDAITVTNAAGQTLSYSVVAREVVDKQMLPTSELFAIEGAPRLTLITCGGWYDRDAGGYQANVVVTAVPTT